MLSLRVYNVPTVSAIGGTVEGLVHVGEIGTWAMRQRKLGSHTPPCHRRMVITTLFSVLLAALHVTGP